MKISVTDPDNPTVTTTRDAESVVVLNCGEEGVDIGDSEEDATAFWVVLPPKTFSNGFSVSILTSDDREIVKSTKKSVTVERNVILPMKAFEISVLPEVVPDYQWYVDASGDEYLIGNAEELVALAKLSRGDADALAATGEEAAVTFGGKLVSLTGDIDLAVCCGEASATSWEPIENFMGTLDGNGYTISNLYCNKNGRMGLFDSIEDAKITDLAVEGKIGRSFQGDEPSSVRVGGFVASARNSTFENCVSGVSVETAGISSTCPIALTVGGVCGDAYSCAFIACRSFASINDRQGEWEYTYFLGGVVGYAKSCMVVACMNLGDEVVQANSQAYSYVGGVVGYMQYGDATRIYSCYSSANVAGRQPGQILGAYGTYVGKPNIVASYYSGPSYKGVGSKFYGGNEYSYDYGTSKCTDAAAAVDEMNAGIDQWNESFTDWPCNYEFTLDSDGQLMLVFR